MQAREGEVERVLCKALEDICLEKLYQENCLLALVHAFPSYRDQTSERAHLFSTYQLLVSSVLMATLPRHFSGI